MGQQRKKNGARKKYGAFFFSPQKSILTVKLQH
jgi:hypothetical protein